MPHSFAGHVPVVVSRPVRPAALPYLHRLGSAMSSVVQRCQLDAE